MIYGSMDGAVEAWQISIEGAAVVFDLAQADGFLDSFSSVTESGKLGAALEVRETKPGP
jgi:hypothetical protein